MKILKSAVKKFKIMQRTALRNKRNGYQFEEEVAVRWDITSNGNIKFNGWLKERGTCYNEIRNGFLVDFYDGEYVTIGDHNIEIPQNILKVLYEAVYEEIY